MLHEHDLTGIELDACYWVKVSGEWQIMRYEGQEWPTGHTFYNFGFEIGWSSTELEEIDLKKITRDGQSSEEKI